MLPRNTAPDSSSGKELQAAAEDTGSPSGEGHILLVEDDPDLRALLCRVLRRQGYRVAEAPSGTVALDLAISAIEQCRLVLTDVIMPGMHGIDMVQRLRALGTRCRVIYMTGHFDLPVMPEHGSTVLEKPFRMQTLLDAVRQALDSEPAGRC